MMSELEERLTTLHILNVFFQMCFVVGGGLPYYFPDGIFCRVEVLNFNEVQFINSFFIV